ncbi:MAG TPA: multidrug efflux SMR transporter [Polyangiaceae bacterium]|nr:multidrug efflux SMR transporter [Polyangiaceae bacterium]
MAWAYLVVAGLLEVGWAVGVKYTEGFTRLVPSALTVLALVGSILALSQAARTIPLGTAYAVWVGIGAFGTAVFGILQFGEPVTGARVAFLGLLLVSVVGLELTGAH